MKNLVILILVSLVMVSCAVTKRDFASPDLGNQLAKATLEQELAANQSYEETAPVVAWWSAFNDPVLDTLIANARRNNLDINTAVANVFAARAVLKKAKFDRLPTVTANGGYTRQRLGENIFVQGVNPTFNQYNSSLDAFWETNLFGRVGDRVKGAAAFQEATLADMKGAYVSVFAEVANNYILLRGVQYQLDIANRNLADQQSTYDLVKSITDRGTGNNLDVSRALAQLEATQATIPPLVAQVEAIKNSISVLIGEVPGNLDANVVEQKPLPDLPATVAVGSLTELVRRRPDVAKAEADLAQQIARYNLSVAELYPNVQFSGSLGFSAIDFGSFGENQSGTWNIAPRISWAAFNLGRVRRQIDQQDAYTLASLNQYEKVVLRALEEIKTAMSNYSNQLENRELLRKSSEASAQAVQFAQERYKAGLDSFIDYLSADRTLLEAENRLAQSEITAATSLVAIYKALGGGWEIVSEQELEGKFDGLKAKDSSTRSQE